MINELKSLKLPGSILRLQIVNNKIYILDNKFILLIYSNETYTLLKKYILLDSEEDKHIYENTVAISKNLDFYHSNTKSSTGSIFTIEQKNIKQSLPIELHRRDVSYAKFSNDSNLLLIGGEDGRTSFFDIQNKRSCFSLEARSDFISSASFSHSDKLVCIGAYDKSLKVHDIHKHSIIAEVDLSDTPEDILFSDDDNYVIGITRDRKVFSYSLLDDSLIYANILLGEWPTSVIRIGINHILVGTKGDILYIFHLDNLSLARRFKVDNVGVKTLKVHKEILYIGYSNGEIKIIDTHFLYTEFEESLKLNKFAKATSLIKDNIFLMTKEIALKYDIVWDQVLDMAKDVLASKDLEKSQKMVRPFLWDKRKKDAFVALQVNIADIKHFESLVDQESDITAFKFADEKEHLQTIKSYQTIQTNFNKKFQVAKNLFTKESRQDIQSAKNILTPYLKIDSKKVLINNLMQNYKVFARSTRLVKARNFKVYFRLVQNNDFLKDESLYSKIIEIGNQTYSQLLKLEQEGDYTKANKIASYLEDFIPFTEHVLDIKEIIQSKIDLKSLILTDNTKLIYEKISLSNELELSSIFTEYHKIFEGKKEVATFFANEGESSKVMDTLKSHIEIEYLLNSIAMVFKVSYLVEIENKMQKDADHINMRETLQRYSILYGIDDDLRFLAKKMKFTQLVPDYPPNSIGFKTHRFFENIVVSS